MRKHAKKDIFKVQFINLGLEPATQLMRSHADPDPKLQISEPVVINSLPQTVYRYGLNRLLPKEIRSRQ
jgi:hypothetical protein